MNRSCFVHLLFGFVLGITVTIGSAYAWYEWFGGREYIKDRITQEVAKTVTEKITKPASIVNPLSWFGK
jgi:hypothetical protein